MAIEQRIHFDYEDKEVKLNFSFDVSNKDKCLDQMRKFRELMKEGLEDLTLEIETRDLNINKG